MRYNSIHYPMGEKMTLAVLHFVDMFIFGGWLYTFMSTFGDWQSVISVSILIMFSVLRGASLFEDIQNKKEVRRKQKIENDHIEWENKVKRGK